MANARKLDGRMVAPWLCLGAALVLAGCSGSGTGDIRRAFGFERAAPDEFAVLSRAPLAMPPEYDLRPPRPGAPRPQEGEARDRAQSVLLGAGAQARVTGDSPGETALLTAAGAGSADPAIRQQIDREEARLLREERTFVDRLLFWQQTEPGTVINPDAEAERLAAARLEGRPVDGTGVPIIERRRRAPLEGLF